MARNGKNIKTGKPLSQKTVIHHLNFMSDIFVYAARLELIDNNPCKNIVVPRGKKKEKSVYTVDEVKKLFALIEEHKPYIKYKAFVTLAVYSGFRRGELLGLEWKDVDWDNNVISVRRTSNYTSTSGRYTDTTKTKSSQRSLKLPDAVFDTLRNCTRISRKQKKRSGVSGWIAIGSSFLGPDRRCFAGHLTIGSKNSQKSTI